MSNDAGQKPARTKISLPSFREVQAAQKSKAAPNFFHGSSVRGQNITTGTAAPAAHDKWPSTSQDAGTALTGVRQSSTIVEPSFAPPTAPGLSAPAGPLGPNIINPFGALPGLSSRHGDSLPSSSYPVSYPAANTGLVDYRAHNASTNSILVSRRQEGNPVLKYIRNARWAFADIVPDYIMGADTCALFLSLRFHLLKPEYVHHRIKELQRSFRLRVLLCHVDVDDVVDPLQQVTRAALLNDVTLICAWSPEECARYLETYKVYETKPADAILGRSDEDYLSRLNAALTTVRGVNKTDVLTLGSNFHTAARIMQASMEDLSACPGIGPTKVRRLYNTFHEPFRKTLQSQGLHRVNDSTAQSDSSTPLGLLPGQTLPIEDTFAVDEDNAEDFLA